MSHRDERKRQALKRLRERYGNPPSAAESGQKLLRALDAPVVDAEPLPAVVETALPAHDEPEIHEPPAIEPSEDEDIACPEDDDLEEEQAPDEPSSPPFFHFAENATSPPDPVLRTWGPDPGVAKVPLAESLAPLVDTLDENRTLTIEALGDVDPDVRELVRVALDPSPVAAIAADDPDGAFDLLADNTGLLVRHAKAANARIAKASADIQAADLRAVSAEDAVAGWEAHFVGLCEDLAGARSREAALSQLVGELQESLAGRADEVSTLTDNIAVVRSERDAACRERDSLAADNRRLTEAARAAVRRPEPDARTAERALEERVRSIVTELSEASLDIPRRYRALYDAFMDAKAEFYEARGRRAATVRRMVDQEQLAAELDSLRGTISMRGGIAPVESIDRYERMIERTQSLRAELDRNIADCERTLGTISAIQCNYRQTSEAVEQIRAKLAHVPELCDVFDLPMEPEIRTLIAEASRRLTVGEQTRSVSSFAEQVPGVPQVLETLYRNIPSHRAFLLSVRGWKVEELFVDKVSRKDAIGRMVLIAYRVLVSDERGRSHNTVVSILTAGKFVDEREAELAKSMALRVKSLFTQERFRAAYVWKPTDQSKRAGDDMLNACRDRVAVEELLRRAQNAVYTARRAASAEDVEEDESVEP